MPIYEGFPLYHALNKARVGGRDITDIFRAGIEENKITLSLSDVCCEGFLIDKDLEGYIKKEIKNFPFYDEINEEIKEYYLLVAQRKFFFFLDPKRTGKIYINDIVTSNILT